MQLLPKSENSCRENQKHHDKTFDLIDKLTGEINVIVVFVAVLPHSQYIYVEGIISTAEPQWSEVNNHALNYFGGVPTIVVYDNCKQAVTVNRDWIDPDLNKAMLPGGFGTFHPLEMCAARRTTAKSSRTVLSSVPELLLQITYFSF